MDSPANLLGCQTLAKRSALPFRNPDDKKVMNGFVVLSVERWKCDSGNTAKYLMVFLSVPPAKAVPRVQSRQLDIEDGGLQAIEAAVVAHEFVKVLTNTAMVAQFQHSFGERNVVGHGCTAVTVGS